MNNLLKINATKELNKTVYFYFFSWGFFFYSAGYFTYKKLISNFTNIQWIDKFALV